MKKYENYYERHFTPERYKAYQDDFKQRVGKLYALSTGPYFLKNSVATKIRNDVLPSLIKLLDSKEYQDGIYKRGWFLPPLNVEKKDFFGSADFHVNGDEIRLIELNFFITGHFGLMELFPKLFSKRFEIEFEIFSDGFEARLAEFFKSAFFGNKIALAVNHLGLSVHYFEHYKYVEEFLNKQGVDAKVVYAKDASVSQNNKPMWDGEEYDGVFNMVIPRIWEHNKEEFASYTDLFCKLPKLFFPNPWCWTIGDKRFLNTLSSLKEGEYGLSEDEIANLKKITLKTALLSSFSSAKEASDFFGGAQNMVLKPIDNYHTQGVYIQPSIEKLQEVFDNEKDVYVAQEYFISEKILYKDENGRQVEPWRTQLRVEFFDGEFLNFRAYGFSDPFGLSPMTPVITGPGKEETIFSK